MTPLATLSGHFLLLGLVLRVAGAGLPLQPMAQHAKLWGRRTPAAILQFWGTRAAPQLCALPEALLTATAKRKDKHTSHTPLPLLLAPPLLSILPLRPSQSVLPTSLSNPWCQTSAFLYQVCPAGAVLVRARGGRELWESSSWHFSDRLSPVLLLTSRIPAALNKAAPSGVLRAGLYFVLFLKHLLFNKGLGSAS